VVRSPPVMVWKVNGEIGGSPCGPGLGPLRRVPDSPAS
jgi:hypothetical protein